MFDRIKRPEKINPLLNSSEVGDSEIKIVTLQDYKPKLIFDDKKTVSECLGITNKRLEEIKTILDDCEKIHGIAQRVEYCCNKAEHPNEVALFCYAIGAGERAMFDKRKQKDDFEL